MLNIFSVFIAFFSILYGFAQSKPDTLKLTKDDFVMITKKNGVCFYQEGNKLMIDCPADYTALIKPFILNQTKPYVLALYYDKAFKNLFSIGLANNSSYTGSYECFYENGKLKTKGVFTEQDSLKSGDANVKKGTWFIYDEKGKLTREERWSYGELVSNKGWDALPIYGLEMIINNEVYRKAAPISLKKLNSIQLVLKTMDNDFSYGRFQCNLMITGGKSPLKQLSVDYTALAYFDFKRFIADYWQPSSNLFIEVEDTKTATFFNTVIKIID